MVKFHLKIHYEQVDTNVDLALHKSYIYLHFTVHFFPKHQLSIFMFYVF